MSIPADLRRRGTVLLNQQCWVWGRDILRPEGNLLIEYGFERKKPPEGMCGSSQYTLKLACGAVIRLWGFGIFYGHTRGIHLNRYEFEPWVARMTEDVWQADQLTRLFALRGYSALRPAFLWIAAYEQWVLCKCGHRYRKRCLAEWAKEKVKPQRVSEEWVRLAHDIGLLCRYEARCRRFQHPRR